MIFIKWVPRLKKMEAKIIADSIDCANNRLTTFILRFPRFIDAELLTHRVFSRNANSSRAIPANKFLAFVIEDPFIPMVWPKAHKGMQATANFTDPTDIEILNKKWLEMRDAMLPFIQFFIDYGVSKQITNRPLQCFMWHTMILSSTDFSNFFKLRDSPMAEPHLATLAKMMRKAYDESKPKLMEVGDMHIPFAERFDEEKVIQTCHKLGISSDELKMKIATARCARISYGLSSDESKYDYEKDVELHDLLVKDGHLSPLEHIATNDAKSVYYANFKGWKQYRKVIEEKE